MGTIVPIFLMALLPAPAGAQGVICCNLLLSIGGNWIGASRQCEQTLAQAKPEQVQRACRQLKGRVCAELAPFCPACTGEEAKTRNPGGDALAPGAPVYDGLVEGAREGGIAGFGPEHLAAQDRREKDGRVFWQIRLDAEGCALPGGDCILAAGESGRLPEGKQPGAPKMVVGSVQFAGNAVRVNGRTVAVETGIVENAAVSATVTGTDRAAVAKAMTDMLRKLGLRCGKARGLEF